MKKTQRNRLILVLLSCAVAAAYLLLTKSSKNPGIQEASISSASKAPELFHGIPPEGIGGDPLLNRQKNRWTPPDTFVDHSIDQIFSFAHEQLDVAGKKHRR